MLNFLIRHRFITVLPLFIFLSLVTYFLRRLSHGRCTMTLEEGDSSFLFPFEFVHFSLFRSFLCFIRTLFPRSSRTPVNHYTSNRPRKSFLPRLHNLRRCIDGILVYQIMHVTLYYVYMYVCVYLYICIILYSRFVTIGTWILRFSTGK